MSLPQGERPVDSGTEAKLRASCDSCNEAKVRCSQTKPTCARCARKGSSCIYGLSRRSHKTAPRIGESASSVLSAHTWAGPDLGDMSGSSSYRHDTTGRPAAGDGSGTSDFSYDFSAYTHLPESHPRSSAHQPSAIHQQLMAQHPPVALDFDLSSRGIGLGALLPLSDLDGVSMVNPESAHAPSSTLSKGEDESRSRSDSAGYDTPISRTVGGQPIDGKEGCKCSLEIVSQLSLILQLCHDKISSLDVQLSHLKGGIKMAEAVMQCQCLGNIMLVGILIGRILDGFETLMARCGLTSTSPSATSSTNSSEGSASAAASTAVPRISWGVLQIEDADEDELKHRLFLLSLRRTESVLGQFNESVRQLSTTAGMQDQSSGTYALACGRIHTWLEQRIRTVKDSFAFQDINR
ncbi:hypothetical protein DL765_007890 [Monosporascus sp. GIB2]|nr:hypothetical protein DL765_007890 [Monosporascus sp. GIB2]